MDPLYKRFMFWLIMRLSVDDLIAF